jgi:hypothetical protein
MAIALGAMALPGTALRGMAEPETSFSVDFSNPQLSPSHWTITVYPDGSGHFHSERGNAPAPNPPVMETPNMDRDIRLSEQFTAHVFQVASQNPTVNRDCESHFKVAFQGLKKLTYNRPEGGWSCEFNYARDKQMRDLGDSMMAVATTVLEGARLEQLLHHDRLGLDKELEYISDGVGEGRMMQICAIRGILEQLSEDPDVMERVRKRARVLLASKEK